MGGRSKETSTFVWLLAKAKPVQTFHLAHSDGTGMVEPLGRSSGVCCWSCSREFLVGSPWGGGVDGDIPQPFDVERDWRHVC